MSAVQYPSCVISGPDSKASRHDQGGPALYDHPSMGPSQRPIAVRPMLIAVAGVALGVATLAGQAVLSAEWNRLANSGAIWLLCASAAGSRMPTNRWAMFAGVGVLVGAVLGYYAAAMVAGAAAGPRIMAIWIGTALVGGPVYGLVGRWWRGGPGSRRVLAIGLMGGILAGEGASTVLRIPDLARVGWVEVIAGIALTALLGRSVRERLLGLAVLPFVVAAVIAAYEVIDRVIAAG
jgi:hypothetical protein